MFARIFLLSLFLLLPLVVQAQQPNPEVDAAQKILQQFRDGDYTDIYAQLGDQVKAAVTQDQLQEAWEGIVKSAGDFQRITNISADPASHNVTLTLQFQHAPLDLHVVFDPSGKVVGLRFTPSASAAIAAPTPTYADPSAFTETPVTVGDLKLPGILTMPSTASGAGPFPAVVLVAGSGPSDHDETIGPNKPFRDLAWGLAAQGVATLRYDKRTLAARNDIDITNFTLNDEYVPDAVAAVEQLRQTDKIDPARVFVLGHSLGGYAAPRIAKADPHIAGLIVASGLAIPLQDSFLNQNRYIASLRASATTGAGTPEATEDPQLAAVEDLVNQINALTPDSPKNQNLLGAAPAYWLDLRGYDPAALAASLPQPILVLQGGRDYQVTTADDLPLWQAGLADHPDTTFKLYPDLNHLYVTGTGKSVPSEYDQPGNVAPEVIDDIATWVKAH